MKIVRNSIVSFLIGVGIVALVEAFISVALGVNSVGVPAFVDTVAPGHAKIIQCFCYGGFGLLSYLCGEFFGNRKGAFYLMQGLHFLILLVYFLFVGFYLKWFSNPTSALYSGLGFVASYILIWIAIYFKEKRLVEKMNEQLK